MAPTRSDGAPTRETPLWVWVGVAVTACATLVLEIVDPITALSWFVTTGLAAAGVAIGLVTPTTRLKGWTTMFIFMFVMLVLVLVLRRVSHLVFEAVVVTMWGLALGAALRAILQIWRRPQTRIQ